MKASQLSSTTKTLELLGLFSANEPELGLSRICRMANRDKATTFRHLQALEGAGLVEQNPVTKQYRLGPALLHLAQMREITVPRKAGVLDAIDRLSERTGETAHVSVLSGTTAFSLASSESSKHSIRAIIDVATLPLHATASGICALAFGPSSLLQAAKTDLGAFTSRTLTNLDALNAEIERTKRTGFAFSDGGFEKGVVSLAAPIFDQTGMMAGAVAVASVSVRFDQQLEEIIKSELSAASRQITRNWGGRLPTNIEMAWENTQAKPELEPSK